MENVLDEWQELLAARQAEQPHRDLILLSWSRSRLAGLDPRRRPELLLRAVAAAGAIRQRLTGSAGRLNA